MKCFTTHFYTVKFLFACFLLCLPLLSIAQVVNDECNGAIDLGIIPSCETTVYTNVEATRSTIGENNIPACFNGGNVERDVWFTFRIPSDGSIENVNIEINTSAEEGIALPQVALYRGSCQQDQLSDLGICRSAALGEGAIQIQAFGLTTDIQYFLRINDYSTTATPNWGNFTVCIEQILPIFNMGEVEGTTLCEGILYDSGGPDGIYSSGENETFTICPDDFNQCIELIVETYDTEERFDEIFLFDGRDEDVELIGTATGTGFTTIARASSGCATVAFASDFSLRGDGFKLSWQCTPSVCPPTEESSCANATTINSLPYQATDLSTCFAGNTIESGPCTNSDFLEGNEFIFAYSSEGGECIGIEITGVIPGTGVSVMLGCPSDNMAESVCFGQDSEVSGDTLRIPNVSLREAGTYYIVLAQEFNCTPFNISVVTAENCPMVFPSAAACSDALILNGCDGDLPAALTVEPGQGDPDFFRFGINNGCWEGVLENNYTWFTFEAQADGDFAFFLSNNIQNEDLDIDFNIWGPFTSIANACGASSDSQPIRSSWADDLISTATGLTNTNPVLGTPVTATCQGALSDGFVRPIQAKKGEVYVVLVNDFDGIIFNGAVSIDFRESSPGVLGAIPASITLSPDTSICVGEAVALNATGGSLYEWFPSEGLSCVGCPNPIARPTKTTRYTVNASSVCNTFTNSVEVEVYDVDAGADQTVCLGQVIEIAASTNTDNVQFEWTTTAAANTLSCTTCANPIITASNTGTYEYFVKMTTPFCILEDAFELTVIEGMAVDFALANNQTICVGDSVNLGGAAIAGNLYSWTSSDSTFSTSLANPIVQPTVTTTYFLSVENASCSTPSIGTVTVEVMERPTIQMINDTTICQGSNLILSTDSESGVDYQWSSSDPQINETTPSLSIIAENSETYTLSAVRNTCSTRQTINVEVIPVDVQFQQMQDTLELCLGESLSLSLSTLPAGTLPSITNNMGLDTVATAISIMPTDNANYIAAVSAGGCEVFDTVYVKIDSLPVDLSIQPADTTICEGTQLILRSPLYEPRNFPDIEHVWMPDAGFQTPDSLYNLVLTPTDTVLLMRVNTNGACIDTSFATINVNPIAEIPIVPQEPLVCIGNSLQLMAEIPDGAEELMWMPETDCTGCATPSISPSMTTTYTLMGTLNDCPISGSTTIEVIDGATVSIERIGASDIFQGDTIRAAITATEQIVDIEWLEDGVVINGATGELLEHIPVATSNLNDEPITVEITARVTTIDGCVAIVSLQYIVTPPFEQMPNAFTPNGDGSNDHFNLVFIGSPTSLTIEFFEIYNRWGKRVYNNDTPDQGWDGNYQGKRQNPDVYIYTIRYRVGSRVETLSGDVTLIR